MNEEVTEWKKEWIKNPGFFDSQTPAFLPLPPWGSKRTEWPWVSWDLISLRIVPCTQWLAQSRCSIKNSATCISHAAVTIFMHYFCLCCWLLLSDRSWEWKWLYQKALTFFFFPVSSWFQVLYTFREISLVTGEMIPESIVLKKHWLFKVFWHIRQIAFWKTVASFSSPVLRLSGLI